MTAVVLSFIHTLRTRAQHSGWQKLVQITSHIDQARILWPKDAQTDLTKETKFNVWKCQVDLYTDSNCGKMGRWEDQT